MAFVWELTKEIIDLPLGCLQVGAYRDAGLSYADLCSPTLLETVPFLPSTRVKPASFARCSRYFADLHSCFRLAVMLSRHITAVTA